MNAEHSSGFLFCLPQSPPPLRHSNHPQTSACHARLGSFAVSPLKKPQTSYKSSSGSWLLLYTTSTLSREPRRMLSIRLGPFFAYLGPSTSLSPQPSPDERSSEDGLRPVPPSPSLQPSSDKRLSRSSGFLRCL